MHSIHCLHLVGEANTLLETMRFDHSGMAILVFACHAGLGKRPSARLIQGVDFMHGVHYRVCITQTA